MPNRKGNDKQAMERRRFVETINFNARCIEMRMEFLSLLLAQGIRNMDFPPEWLTSAAETAKEVEQWNKEILDELKK